MPDPATTTPSLRTSVALCTRDGARFVAEQVASIVTQSLPPAEIVLSDDASMDDTVAIAQRAVAEYTALDQPPPVLRVIENVTPLGVRGNFQQAMLACTGDLVALCDQDDRWEAARLERFTSAFVAQPEVELVHCGARLVDAHSAPLGRSLAQAQGISASEAGELCTGEAFATLLRRPLATGATVVVRRSLVDRALPVPTSWVHDEWLAIVAAASGSTRYLPEVLGDYRQHSSNAIGVGRSRWAKVRLLFAPRDARNTRLVERSSVLLERLTTLGAPDESIGRVRAKLAHEQLRANLPRSRALRLRPVLREARRGGYSDFGLGRRDVARDLLQSAR